MNSADAEVVQNYYQHYCDNPKCGHAEKEHAVDGPCKVKGCECGQFKDLVI